MMQEVGDIELSELPNEVNGYGATNNTTRTSTDAGSTYATSTTTLEKDTIQMNIYGARDVYSRHQQVKPLYVVFGLGGAVFRTETTKATIPNWNENQTFTVKSEAVPIRVLLMEETTSKSPDASDTPLARLTIPVNTLPDKGNSKELLGKFETIDPDTARQYGFLFYECFVANYRPLTNPIFKYITDKYFIADDYYRIVEPPTTEEVKEYCKDCWKDSIDNCRGLCRANSPPRSPIVARKLLEAAIISTQPTTTGDSNLLDHMQAFPTMSKAAVFRTRSTESDGIADDASQSSPPADTQQNVIDATTEKSDGEFSSSSDDDLSLAKRHKTKEAPPPISARSTSPSKRLRPIDDASLPTSPTKSTADTSSRRTSALQSESPGDEEKEAERKESGGRFSFLSFTTKPFTELKNLFGSKEADVPTVEMESPTDNEPIVGGYTEAEERASAEKVRNTERKPGVFPHVKKVEPHRGPTTGGTRLSISGRNLGNSKADVVGIYVCGGDCLASLEYHSPTRIYCTTKEWRECSGAVTILTASGGRSLTDARFTFVAEEPITATDEEQPPQHRRQLMKELLVSRNEQQCSSTDTGDAASLQHEMDGDFDVHHRTHYAQSVDENPPAEKQQPTNSKRANLALPSVKRRTPNSTGFTPTNGTAVVHNLRIENGRLKKELHGMQLKVKDLEKQNKILQQYTDDLVKRVLEEVPEALCIKFRNSIRRDPSVPENHKCI